MRVTFRAIDDGLAAINAAAEQFVRAQQQVETGKRLRVSSDDPGGMLRVIEGRTELGAIDAYTRASDTAGSRLAIMDTLLGDVVDKITESQVTAAAARGTTANQQSRNVLAAKLQGLRDGLVSDFNSTFRGIYLFGGSRSGVTPYAQVAGAWTYQGDQTPVTVDIGRNRSVTTSFNGQAIVQGGDATDLFSEMDALITAVQTGDEAGMASGMDALTRAFNRAVQAQSVVGVDELGIDEEKARLTDFRLASVKRISKDEDTNMVEAITEMTQADTAYRAALEAIGKASKVSLLDYLR